MVAKPFKYQQVPLSVLKFPERLLSLPQKSYLQIEEFSKSNNFEFIVKINDFNHYMHTKNEF